MGSNAIDRKVESLIGLEAEFLLYNKKGELLVPPASWDRDGFPILGEIRGGKGATVAETITNFMVARMKVLEMLKEGYSIKMLDRERVPLALYRKANAQVSQMAKEAQESDIKNIYGTDISEFSDQIVKGRKIQGIWVSCGLHIHFSCGLTEEFEYEEEQYELVTLPMGLSINGVKQNPDEHGHFDEEPLKLAKELLNPCLYLYRRKGWKKGKKVEVSASRLCKPAVEYIVKGMDKAFFEKFAPAADSRTKYRQPGFFELKPYGFEYRSLPANDATMSALSDIVKEAFNLLKGINEY